MTRDQSPCDNIQGQTQSIPVRLALCKVQVVWKSAGESPSVSIESSLDEAFSGKTWSLSSLVRYSLEGKGVDADCSGDMSWEKWHQAVGDGTGEHVLQRDR